HFVDRDGDDVADERRAIGIEFDNGMADPEHAANAPTFGLDQWIVLARFGERLRRDADGDWLTEPCAPGGQWGLSMDDQGHWFFNTNSDHLRAHLAPPHYASRHPDLERPAFVNQQVCRDQTVWPIRVTPGVN